MWPPPEQWLNQLTSREMALISWAGALLLYALSASSEARVSAGRLVQSLLSPKLLLPVVLLGVWVWAVVGALIRLNLWSAPDLKTTVIWLIFAGIPLTFAGVNLGNERTFLSRLKPLT